MAIEGINSIFTSNGSAITGSITNPTSSNTSAGIKGIHNGTSGLVCTAHKLGQVLVFMVFPDRLWCTRCNRQQHQWIWNIWYQHGRCTGITGTSQTGLAGYFDITNGASTSEAVLVTNGGSGNGLSAWSSWEMVSTGMPGMGLELV
jgi:hypothetical protein